VNGWWSRAAGVRDWMGTWTDPHILRLVTLWSRHLHGRPCQGGSRGRYATELGIQGDNWVA
jgi:hypothetical protein